MTGSWYFFALGALAAKTLPVLEGSWRYMGGASIVFHGLRTFIFGKVVKTIEYPDGEMVSLVVRTNNINRLKNEIIKHQPPIFPGVELDSSDIKYLSRWTPPHFAETITSKRDLKLVGDNGVVFWSRFDSIPKRGVSLDFRDKDNIIVDQAMMYVSKMGKLSNLNSNIDESLKLNDQQENALLDLIMERNDAILSIFRNFNAFPHVFKYHSLRYLYKNKGFPNFEEQQNQSTSSSPHGNNTTTGTTNQQHQHDKEKKEKEKEKKENQPQTTSTHPSPHDLTNTVT